MSPKNDNKNNGINLGHEKNWQGCDWLFLLPLWSTVVTILASEEKGKIDNYFLKMMQNKGKLWSQELSWVVLIFVISLLCLYFYACFMN